MFFKLSSFALVGIEAIEVSVEAHISNGIPSLTVVGLPDKAVNESRQRVRAAIINSGYKFPMKRIIINLSPADIRKEGPFYDLPVAIAILAVSCQINLAKSSSIISISSFIGELSLDGNINPVKGVISMAELCRKKDKKYFFIPSKNTEQVQFIPGLSFVKCRCLKEVLNILSINHIVPPNIVQKKDSFDFKDKNNIHEGIDFSDIKGQLRAKRAVIVAASGMHNIILIGPPGAGKTMLAQRIVTIMPELSIEESMEVTKIYCLHKGYNEDLIKKRPFRNPHHSISKTGMVGGGIVPKPGEISMAHRGVLFLDEFSQFPRRIIEDLRQPIENKEIIISRSNSIYRFPCSFMLVMATNPCSCGFNGDERKQCRCSPVELIHYWNNISGPIFDRIDMRINMPRLANEDMSSSPKEKESDRIRKKVTSCHKIQQKRYSGTGINYNSEADFRFVNKWMVENEEIRKLITEISEKFDLSGRAISSLLKVSRTLADMENCQNILKSHLMEALNYRFNFNYEQIK